MEEEMKKLQCKYCGTIMDEDRHSACEHSNSAYGYLDEEAGDE